MPDFRYFLVLCDALRVGLLRVGREMLLLIKREKGRIWPRWYMPRQTDSERGEVWYIVSSKPVGLELVLVSIED